MIGAGRNTRGRIGSANPSAPIPAKATSPPKLVVVGGTDAGPHLLRVSITPPDPPYRNKIDAILLRMIVGLLVIDILVVGAIGVSLAIPLLAVDTLRVLAIGR